MTDKTYATRSGKTLADADIEQLADDAAHPDFDIDAPSTAAAANL